MYPMDELDPTEGSVLPKTRKKVAGGALTQDTQPMSRERLSGIYSQLDALEKEPVDMSALQGFAKQQGVDGDWAMLNALAAGVAGERFQPLQAQFLKKAAAAAEPMKVGGGLLTSDGKFIKDPIAARDSRRTALERQATALETAIDKQDTRDQARTDKLDQQAWQRQFLEGQQAERVAGQAAARADRAAARAQGDEGKAFKIADNLRGEYLKRSDKVREGVSHAQTASQLLADPTLPTDPTKQVALIFSFGKMLDPDSVVRESEYALIANARGLGDRLQQLVPQIATGARLTPQQLQSMQAITSSLLSGAKSRVSDLDQYYEDLARRRKVDPQDVLPSYRQGRSGGGNVVDFNSLPK